MHGDDYLAALRRDSADLVGAAGSALGATVPPCPEWTGADLLLHAGEVAGFWRRIAAGELTGPAAYALPPRPADAELPAWAAAELAALADTLAGLDPAAPCWSWTSDRTIGGALRRVAHEFAVHAWDARAAAGRDTPLEPELATDGVAEYLAHFLPTGKPGGELPGLRLAAADTGAEWLVRGTPDGWQVVDGPASPGARPAVTVTASASELDLLLWRRRDPATLTGTVDGAAEVLDACLAAADLSGD